jgi:hypothetical protein
MIRYFAARTLYAILILSLCLFVFVPEWPEFGDEEHQLMTLVGLRQFDFLIWETNAFATKAEAILGNGHTYLSDTERRQVVVDYMELVGEIGRLEGEINQIYIDPALADPDIASQELQTELAQQRTTLSQVQPLAEAIIQDQVADILVEEGFVALQEAWPPVLMHMTPLPSVLIVSPRSHIERQYQVELVNGLSTPVRDELETAVYNSLDLSALVVPIGGLGTFPSMITESSDINWLFEVVSHEWAHNWLGFKPLGLNYGADPQVRIINETAVSIIDQEIGRRVIENYYPEYLPPPPEPATTQLEPTPVPEPPRFDFRAEMAATRILADSLLAEGQIDAAEIYMEERRKTFVANGYNIRKINQAYFAFYGAYADQPGATGGDPIGPLLHDIRQHSDSVHQFLERVGEVNSFAELQLLHQAVIP